MIERVYDILKPLGVPVKYILRPDIKTSGIGISYHFFNEGDSLFGDGVGGEPGGSMQVDIFSTNDYSNVVENVKAALKENKFRFADGRDSDDSINGMQYYHKILIFNYIEKEVTG